MIVFETTDVINNVPEIGLGSDTTKRGSDVSAYPLEMAAGGNWWIDFKDCDRDVFVANARAIINAIPPERVAWIVVGHALMRVETSKSAGRKIQPRITKILNDFFDKSEEDQESQLAAVLADTKNVKAYGLEGMGKAEWGEGGGWFDFHRDVFLEHIGVIVELFDECSIRIAVHKKFLRVEVTDAENDYLENCDPKFKELGWITKCTEW